MMVPHQRIVPSPSSKDTTTRLTQIMDENLMTCCRSGLLVFFMRGCVKRLNHRTHSQSQEKTQTRWILINVAQTLYIFSLEPATHAKHSATSIMWYACSQCLSEAKLGTHQLRIN